MRNEYIELLLMYNLVILNSLYLIYIYTYIVNLTTCTIYIYIVNLTIDRTQFNDEEIFLYDLFFGSYFNFTHKKIIRSS